MDERQSRSDRWRRLRIFVGLVGVAFAVTLATIIGNRLSDEALAVLAGAACGVGAAIPTSLIVVAVTRRREESRDASAYHPSMQLPVYPQGAYPPVVVIAPPGMQQRPDVCNGLPPSLVASTPRTFTIVGGAPSMGGAPSDVEVPDYYT